MMKMTSDAIIGHRIDEDLLAQKPINGEKINWPKGFAATMNE